MLSKKLSDSPQSSAFSLDHLIRPPEYLLRYCQTDLLRCREIYHQLELRRLLHRQIRGLGALQDFVDVYCDEPVAVCDVRPVGYESAGIYNFFSAVHRRQPAL